MSFWSGKSVIVTGAASGIGLALSGAMARRGAKVWLSDVNEAAVREAASRIGGDARAATLDVTDADAFKALVGEVVAEHGYLDVLFNNAGIGSGGAAEELDFSHFDRVVEVNVRGVTNGFVAAYAGMVRRGEGIIVNVASTGGLIGVPGMAPYCLTKHAVVGFTSSVRVEAAEHGVQVCALCPATIETPILDSDNPVGTPEVWRPDMRRYLSEIGGAPYPVEKFADYALRQIEKDKAIIVAPLRARVLVSLGKFFPGLVEVLTRRAYRKVWRQRAAGHGS